MLMKIFWLKRNYHAWDVLESLFDHLMRLSQANNHFTLYMSNSEASANDVLVNIYTLRQQITSPSIRTSDMIDSIEKVLTIDLNKWTSYSAHHIATNENRSVSNEQVPALTHDFD